MNMNHKRTLRRCRSLMLLAAGVFAISLFITILNMFVISRESAMFKVSMGIWFLCTAIELVLCIPIAKTAICVECGRSILQSNMDSIWNTVPLFEIMLGDCPRCKECLKRKDSIRSPLASDEERE